MKTTKAQVKRWSIVAAGWTFLVLGIAGLVLPFLQGILFILIGLSLLSYEYHWARTLIARLRDRFPGLSRQLDHAQDWIRVRSRRLKARWRTLRWR